MWAQTDFHVDEWGYRRLGRWFLSGINNSHYNPISGMVVYMYVDRDLIISGEQIVYPQGIINAFSFSLQEGWNAIYEKMAHDSNSMARTYELKNPDIIWMIPVDSSEYDEVDTNIIERITSSWFQNL